MTNRIARLSPGFMLSAVFVASSIFAQAPPPNINQCKSKWVLTPLQQIDFGGFSIEAGSGTISMNSLAGRITTGLVNLSTSIPATTFSANIDNTRGTNCAGHGFSLDWNTSPAPLAGAGSPIPFSNPLVSIPAYGLNNVTLPQTIAPNPANPQPFTLLVHGDIAVNSPQTAGLYTSPAFVVDLIQSGTATPVSGTASATSFTPLSIVENVSMDFGTVAGGSATGTVILSTGGGRSVTGDAQILAAGPGNAAAFQVSGEPNQVYSLAFGNGTLSDGSGNQIGVSSFTDNSLGTLPGSGIETFQVGATLSIGASQAAGSYSTSNAGGVPYTITINYN